MKKISAATWLLVFTMLFSCSREEKKSKLAFDNNIESIYWGSSPNTIKFANAHSGNYVCKLDKTNPFSQVFNIKVKDLSTKPLRRAKISAWFMLTGNYSEQNLVLDVRDSSMQQSLEWINTDAIDYVKDLNKWGKAELIVDLTKKNRNNPNNVFRIYASNGKEEPIYVDDFEIQFEE